MHCMLQQHVFYVLNNAVSQLTFPYFTKMYLFLYESVNVFYAISQVSHSVSRLWTFFSSPHLDLMILTDGR